LLTSLLSFNIGVELGQILVLLLLMPMLELFLRRAVAERMGTIILSALVAHTGWHWMLERGERLSQFRFQRPELTPALMASAMHWLMLIMIAGGVVWCVRKGWAPKWRPQNSSVNVPLAAEVAQVDVA